MFDVMVITDKGANTQRVRCTLRHCTIGKSQDNLVQIRGWRVAQQHCKVELTDKGIYVEDISEGAGITVNGNKVPYYGPIRSADVISIGSYDFRIGAVEEGDSDSAEPAPMESETNQADDWAMKTFIGNSLKEESDEPVDSAQAIERQRLFMWRNRIHQEVLRMMDLRRTDVGAMDNDELREKVESIIDEVLAGMQAEIPDNIDG